MEMKETNLGPSFLRSMQAAGIEKVQEYVKRLEEERNKIEAFKRELPFCMQLLNDAIEASRVQLTEFEGLKLNCSSYDAGAEEKLVLAELMPSKAICENLKTEQDVDEEQEHTRSANWIQLWCKSPQAGMERQWESGTISSTPKAIKQSSSGAFAPFIKWERPADLTLGSGCEEKNLNVEKTSSSEERSKDQSEHEAIVDNQGSSQSQSQRKARRCWSPELHRRFVSALQQLGGSQVATPKQIRELMKVDGLTNDEVKSHLQKYRLHTRRPSPVGATPQSPQLVVLGGIWMPPEYAAIAQQKQNHQDFFTQLKPSAQLHVHPSLFYDSANPKASTPADDSKSDNHVRSKFTADDDSGDGDVTEAEDSRGSETRLHLHIGNEAT